MNLSPLFIFLFALQAHAGNYAFFMGGTENSPSEKMFAAEFGMLSTLMNQDKWDVNYLYNYHAQKTAPFNTENFRKQKEILIQKIKNKEIKSQDQVLLYIGTHGAAPTGSISTHKVAALDGLINLDELKDLVQAAEEQGVKLALVDQSCFSGNLQTLASSKTCVVSGTSRNNFGYGDDSRKFAFHFQDAIRKEKKKKITLEDVFLTARYDSFSPAQPSISTSEGVLTQSFLDNYANALVHLDHYRDRKEYNCLYESLETSIQLRKLRETALLATVKDKKVLSKVKKITKESDALRESIIRERDAALDSEKRQETEICEDSEVAGNIRSNCTKFKYIQKSLDEFKKYKFEEVARDPKKKDGIRDLYEYYKRLTEKPEYKEIAKLEKSLNPTPKWQVDMYVENLAMNERELYNTLYREFQKSKNKENPCRDFVLN